MEPIVNRVAESDIVVYNLEDLWDERPIDELDLAPLLYRGLVLREKAFREAVAAHDWEAYRDRHVAVFCSTDAIIPIWAYMLVAAKLEGIATSAAFGRAADLLRDYFVRKLETENWSRLQDRIVVVKGCASKFVPADAYMIATRHLQRVARKILYGEPCSSVPIWRKPARPPGDRQAGAVSPARLP